MDNSMGNSMTFTGYFWDILIHFVTTLTSVGQFTPDGDRVVSQKDGVSCHTRFVDRTPSGGMLVKWNATATSKDLVGGVVAIFGIFPSILGCIHHPN